MNSSVVRTQSNALGETGSHVQFIVLSWSTAKSKTGTENDVHFMNLTMMMHPVSSSFLPAGGPALLLAFLLASLLARVVHSEPLGYTIRAFACTKQVFLSECVVNPDCAGWRTAATPDLWEIDGLEGVKDLFYGGAFLCADHVLGNPFPAGPNNQCGSEGMGGFACKSACCEEQRKYCNWACVFGGCKEQCKSERGCDSDTAAADEGNSIDLSLDPYTVIVAASEDSRERLYRSTILNVNTACADSFASGAGVTCPEGTAVQITPLGDEHYEVDFDDAVTIVSGDCVEANDGRARCPAGAILTVVAADDNCVATDKYVCCETKPIFAREAGDCSACTTVNTTINGYFFDYAIVDFDFDSPDESGIATDRRSSTSGGLILNCADGVTTSNAVSLQLGIVNTQSITNVQSSTVAVGIGTKVFGSVTATAEAGAIFASTEVSATAGFEFSTSFEASSTTEDSETLSKSEEITLQLETNVLAQPNTCAEYSIVSSVSTEPVTVPYTATAQLVVYQQDADTGARGDEPLRDPATLRQIRDLLRASYEAVLDESTGIITYPVQGVYSGTYFTEQKTVVDNCDACGKEIETAPPTTPPPTTPPPTTPPPTTTPAATTPPTTPLASPIAPSSGNTRSISTFSLFAVFVMGTVWQ